MMAGLQRQLLVFGRLLRRLGLDVHTGRMLDASEALTHMDLGSRDQVFHTLRALLVHRHEDLEVFERAFEAFWRPPGASPGPRSAAADEQFVGAASEIHSGPVASVLSDAPEHEQDNADDTAGVVRVWSDVESLARLDFAEFTQAELAAARAALDRLRWHPGWRTTRRWSPGRGRRIDLRRALALSLRTGGDVVVIPTRHPKRVARPLVLLCDVSGSMERYSRMLLYFAHALGQRHQRFEAFVFSTGLTRITHDVRIKGVDRAVAAAARRVPDWSGGTRIGEALQVFHRRWGRRVLHREPVVLLVSDGWDRGDPQVLRDAVARLQRSCHRLIWLNPLAGTLDYEPLTRGLVAALPFVDDFLPARTLTDLASLSARLNTVGAQATSRGRPDVP